MNPNQPLVCIGVPVYNGEDKIESAVHSLLNQTYTNIRVVISDNASTDRTRGICERLGAEDPRVHYLRQPVNLGPSSNFLTVLDHARSEYFMWLGHDDWLSESYIEECVRTLSENLDVSLACGQAIYYQDGKELFRGVAVQLTQERPRDRVVAYYSMVADNGTFYGLMRRNQLVMVKLRNVMGGDWLTIASMAFLGKVVTLPSISVNRALGGSTVSYEKIASRLGLSRFQTLFPHLAVASCAFQDIAWRDPIYSLPRRARVLLAWDCQRTIRLRHDSSVVGILRRCLNLGKEYGRRLIESARGIPDRERDP